jgi:hypothetical protein
MKFSRLYLNIRVLSVLLLGLLSCTSATDKKEATDSNASGNSKTEVLPLEEVQVTESNLKHKDSLIEKSKSERDLSLPNGYTLFDEIQGDLNGDGLEDYILIIKATKKEKIIQDEYRGELDRNRRGILIYFTDNGKVDLITNNLNCFSSDQEDGGVYFPPELSVEVEQGKLFIHYGHGRYGHWKYTFRYQNSDFELIGFDSSDNFGPIVNRETSINFLTKKKLTRENVNQNMEDRGDEVFEETWEDIEIEKLIKLSEIRDFDSLEIN